MIITQREEQEKQNETKSPSFSKNIRKDQHHTKRDREENKNRESEPTVCFIFHSNIISTTKNDSINDQTTVC